MCGYSLCKMPIIEVGMFENKDSEFTAKPKLLITAGMQGYDLTSISIAMNIIAYIGNIYFNLILNIIFN